MTPEQLSHLIKSRRSVFPKFYNKKSIDRNIIENIMENANWAPTHKLTEPWRFCIMTGEAKDRLGSYMAEKYKAQTAEEKFSEITYKKLSENPHLASCIIAIVLHRDPQERLPEWEELAAVSCAVQNMWLTCAAYSIGCYWATPGPIVGDQEFLGLDSNEKCMGLFYMGYYDDPVPESKRNSVLEKVKWLDN